MFSENVKYSPSSLVVVGHFEFLGIFNLGLQDQKALLSDVSDDILNKKEQTSHIEV